MTSTYTPNLGLRKPEHRDPETFSSWDIVLNTNADQIDAAFGSRSYSVQAQNYIQNADTHSQSLNKLAEALYNVYYPVKPTADEKAALAGLIGYAPNVSNPFVTLNYIQRTRKLVLFPEFAGATFHASGADNTGAITTDTELVSNNRYNFYKWLSSEASIQNYEIIAQLRIPDGFVSWQATALKIAIATESIDPAESHVDIELQKDGEAAGTPLTNQVSAVAGAWIPITIANSDWVISTLVAGDTLNIKITMNSYNYYVKIGAITLQYVGF